MTAVSLHDLHHYQYSEAEYATLNKKKIIPLKYEKTFDLKGSGWLGLLIGGQLYYEVDTDESMMKNLPQIVEALEYHGVVRSSTEGVFQVVCEVGRGWEMAGV